MPLPLVPLIAAGVSAIGGGISSALNRRAAKKQNAQNEKWSREAFEAEKSRDIEFWNMQNAYNDPSAQMDRLKAAGLNPNLIYENGAGSMQGATLKGGSMQQPRRQQEIYQNDFGNIATTAMALRQANANIARTEAETKAIESRTVATDFQNQVNEIVGVSNIASKTAAVNDYLSMKASTDSMQLDTLMHQNYHDPDGKLYNTSDPNSPLARAIRAGIEKTAIELENAKKLGDIRAFEAVIKKFEANLAREGFSPNSPWYIKILGNLLSKYLPSHRESYKEFDPLMGIPPTSQH